MLTTFGNSIIEKKGSRSIMEYFRELQEKDERDKEQEGLSKWYNTENAKKQFENYSTTKNIAIAGLAISILLAILKLAEYLGILPVK